MRGMTLAEYDRQFCKIVEAFRVGDFTAQEASDAMYNLYLRRADPNTPLLPKPKPVAS